MKMLTIVGIFVFITRENFMLSRVEHENFFITSGLAVVYFGCLQSSSRIANSVGSDKTAPYISGHCNFLSYLSQTLSKSIFLLVNVSNKMLDEKQMLGPDHMVHSVSSNLGLHHLLKPAPIFMVNTVYVHLLISGMHLCNGKLSLNFKHFIPSFCLHFVFYAVKVVS